MVAIGTPLKDQFFSVNDSVNLVFRIVDDLEVQELTVGLYQVKETTAEYLYSVVKDVLKRLDISLSNCRGKIMDN